MSTLNVVLHCHSNWSYDGHWTLEAIARLYGRFGVDAVMMTEHDTGFDPASFASYRAACRAASTSRCQLIPGIEYSSPDNDVHILTWGLADFLTEHRPVSETLEAVAAQAGVAVFAHPARRDAFRIFDPAWCPYLAGIEVWNRKTDGMAPGHAAARLVEETGLPATVGQDFHRLNQLYPLTMSAPRPTGDLETGLVAALGADQMTPRAFRRPIYDEDGRLQRAAHDRTETVRKRLRDMRNRVFGR